MPLKSFDPTKCIVTVNTIPVTGWADGDMITVSYDTDHTSKHIGTGGEGRFIDSKDLSGTAMIRLADYSPVNNIFRLIRDSGVQVPISVVDKTTIGDSFFCTSAKMQKTPDLAKGAEAKMNEYPFMYLKGLINHTGAAEV